MNNLFTAKKKRSTVDMVIDSFRDLLMTNKLKPGQKVPSENEICEGLGVSRGSVREAMKIMASLGVVEIKVGDGTYIPAEPQPAIMNPLLFSLLLQKPNLEEIAEFRNILELDIVELIIKNKDRNLREREQLEQNLLQHKIYCSNGGVDVGQIVENDIEFHRIMGRAACNRMIQRIYDFSLDYLEPSIRETYRFEGNVRQAYKIHQKLLDAIAQNNVELAKDAVRFSIDYWQNRQPPL